LLKAILQRLASLSEEGDDDDKTWTEADEEESGLHTRGWEQDLDGSRSRIKTHESGDWRQDVSNKTMYLVN
jgi:hypothetical protein